MQAIEIKLTFASAAEAAAFLQREPRIGSVERPITDAEAQADLEGKPRPAVAKPKAEPVKPKAAAAPVEQETAAAAPASSPAATESAKPGATIEYGTLQKAVFALAGKSREAATAVVAAFGVKTFKELDASRWGEALDAVNAKLAEVA